MRCYSEPYDLSRRRAAEAREELGAIPFLKRFTVFRDRFDEGVAYAQENFGKLGPGKESLTKAQSTLADMLERQPLVLGAIGLAIGAAVSGAFRASDLDRRSQR